MKNTIFKNLDLVTCEIPIGSQSFIHRYFDFERQLRSYKFDFLVVDGPFGYERPKYSRIDVLDIIPHCLEKEFCILMDDYDREGEKRTVQALRSKLKKYNVEFYEKKYTGITDVCMIVSEGFKYLMFY